MHRKLVVLQFLVVCVCSSQASLAPFIHKCTSQDTTCIKESAQAAVPIIAVGIPSLGVDSMDPMRIAKIDTSAPSLKLILSNVTVTGLKDCVIKKVKRDLAKSRLYVKTLCSVDMNGQYETSGNILLLAIEGHGKIHVSLKKALFVTDSHIEIVKKADGLDHWHVKDYQHDFQLLDKASMSFSNLFDGNEVLARAANEVIDGNANDVVMEIGKPMIDVTMKKIMETMNQFYSAVPAQDLALD